MGEVVLISGFLVSIDFQNKKQVKQKRMYRSECFDGFLCYHCSMTKTQGDGEFSGFNEFLCDAMTKRHYFPQFSVSLIGSIITNYM